jgi:hypothetical protein
MIRVVAVALIVMAGFDYAAFGGQYTTNVLRVLSALERVLV